MVRSNKAHALSTCMGKVSASVRELGGGGAPATFGLPSRRLSQASPLIGASLDASNAG